MQRSDIATMETVEPVVVHEIADLIRREDDFLVIGHLRPDGDCLGSCLGLVHLLHGMGKKARFYTSGPVPEFFTYLPGYELIETTEPSDFSGTVIAVDTAELERVRDGFSMHVHANIDHHISNSKYALLNWVDADATAAGEQVYRLAAVLEQPVTREIAICLYTALMTDTGCFRFSNTNERTFRIASCLVQQGADPAAIAEAVYDSRSACSVRLTGMIYASLNYEFSGRLVWNEITRAMLEECGSTESEPEGLSSDLRSIYGVEVAILFTETPEGFCRIGFRSRGAVNVAELAGKLGGGGHRNASGALVRMPYLEGREHALKTIRGYLAGGLV